MRPSIALLAPAALSLLCSVSALSVQSRATTCNGHAELCDRSFGNVTFVGAHDSYTNNSDISNLAVNQDQTVLQQLNDGIRMLQMQAHNQSGVIQLCHTSCILYNGGTLQSYLGTVKSWLDNNPNDVLSLLIVNSDGFAPTDYASVFSAVGLDKVSYSPTSASLPASGWPTLGSLIDAGTRLLTFLDTGADFNSVPYIIDEFTNIWETAFDVTDTTFDCNVNRSKGDTSTSMYLINHFLDIQTNVGPVPHVSAANVTNAVSGDGALGVQALSTCPATNGRYPNFMLVDFYEYGNGSVFEVAATANDVTYSPATPIAQPIASQSGKSGSSSGSTKSGAVPLTIGPALFVAVGMALGAWTVL